MARYFMSDTRLAGLERMMMEPSRRPPGSTDVRKKKPKAKPVKPRSHKRKNPAKQRRVEQDKEHGGMV